MTSDHQIIEQVLSGQTKAYELLVRKYQDRLFNALVHVLRDRHEAEEVTQDAMLKAYEKLSTFRGSSSYYTWLYRIAFNLAISRTRKKRPSVSLSELQENHGLDPAGNGEQPTAHLERSEQADQVHAALQQMSEEYRSVLVLREMEDCDYETISKMLEVPVGTVRSRLSRARKLMREILQLSMGERGGRS